MASPHPRRFRCSLQGAAALAFMLCAGISSSLIALSIVLGADAPTWKHPLKKLGKLDSPVAEVTPFVFQDRLYLIASWRDDEWKAHNAPARGDGENEQVWLHEAEGFKPVARILNGHNFGVAYVIDGRVNVIATDTVSSTGGRRVTLTISDDLKTWSEPHEILKANDNERFFNPSLAHGPHGYVLLIETNDPKWPPFTFKYFTATKPAGPWTQVEGGLYGTNKYVGGPALYFEGDWYYTLYLESLGGNHYETRVTRSKDLVHWQDAPAGRPLITFDPKQQTHAVRGPNYLETNASDAEMIYWKGKTLVYFTGGDQQCCGDMQWAEFAGTPRQLLERFYEP